VGCYSEQARWNYFEYVDLRTQTPYDGPPPPCRAVPDNCVLVEESAQLSDGGSATQVQTVRPKDLVKHEQGWWPEMILDVTF
jgi:hypothetical protein